jgi:uncharacterized protein (DUF983 family)
MKPTRWQAIRRGLRKRCPHCGQGPLFAGWFKHLPQCSHCGLVFEKNPGDTWAFTELGDRLPLALGVAVVYFGFVRYHVAFGLLLLAVVLLLLIGTAPNRWGVGIALDYLSRAYWADPNDPLPPS